ncbi:tetratricopeptide repeat protein [Candidatus Saccharibacteria bacterium]|nr:tetratricopeptide repeat protein [Candidatus Saccharibacteria bacterium]
MSLNKIHKAFFLVSMLTLIGCNSSTAQDIPTLQKQYKQAVQYADGSAATTALLALIVKGQTQYKDTLALVYNRAGMFTQSYLVAKELLEKDPANKKELLELQAQNTSQLGATQDAVGFKDQLLEIDATSSWYHYQKSLLLLNAKKYEACLETTNEALAVEDPKQMQLTVEGTLGENITIPVKAELYNIKGLAHYQLKDNEAAKEAFNKALAIAPEYKTANLNLQAAGIQQSE